MNTIHQYISFLFCPAHKEKQYNKALNTDADCIIFDKRESKSRPSQGIVTVKTRGINQDNEEVIAFERILLVYKKGQMPKKTNYCSSRNN